MKIVVFGGAGFIGHHLVKRLREIGNEVRAVDNLFHPCKAEYGGEIGDIRDFEDILAHVKWADLVYNLAAQIHVDRSIKNPQETIDINVSGALNILEACRIHNKKLIFASSSEVYGSSQTEFMAENHPLDAKSPYGASKVAGDRLCRAYIDTYGMDIAIVRNFNTFGPYQDDTSYGGVIAIFTRQALNNKPITIFGAGNQERDYMYINDALEAYIKVQKFTGEINFGTGKTITIRDLALMIKKITNSSSEIINLPPRPGEVMRLCAGIGKAGYLGFRPNTELERDLGRYIEWYKKFNNV